MTEARPIFGQVLHRLDLAGKLHGHFSVLCLDGVGRLGEKLLAEGFGVVDLLHAHQYAPFFYAAASRRFRGGAMSWSCSRWPASSP